MTKPNQNLNIQNAIIIIVFGLKYKIKTNSWNKTALAGRLENGDNGDRRSYEYPIY